MEVYFNVEQVNAESWITQVNLSSSKQDTFNCTILYCLNINGAFQTCDAIIYCKTPCSAENEEQSSADEHNQSEG